MLETFPVFRPGAQDFEQFFERYLAFLRPSANSARSPETPEALNPNRKPECPTAALVSIVVFPWFTHFWRRSGDPETRHRQK